MRDYQLFQLAALVCILAYLLSFQFRNRPHLQRMLQVASVGVLVGAIALALAMTFL